MKRRCCLFFVLCSRFLLGVGDSSGASLGARSVALLHITAPQVLAKATTEGNVQQGILSTAASLREYTQTMRDLTSRLNEPFVTVNTVSGDAGIKKAQDEYNQLIRNKTPKSKRS